jgi:trigger factor
MQVSIETTSGLERRLTVGIAVDIINEEVAKRLTQVARTARIDGFRPGKIPANVIKRRYGPGARQEVLGEQIQKGFYEAVMQEKLNPAGTPSIETKTDKEDADFEFVATFEVYPEIELNAFDTIEVEKPVAEVKAADVDTMIEVLRKQQAEFSDSTEASKDGDKVNIDFDGYVDGEAFDGGKAEGHELTLGSNSMIPGFESGIVGAKAGDELTIKVTFPAEYQAENLAGKEAEFKIKVNSVQASKLPELNDEFYAKFGVADGGAEKFREDIESNMHRELAQATTARVKAQIMDGLVASNDIDVPAALIDQEILRLQEQAVQQFGGQIEASALPKEMFEEQAKRRVVLGLLINEIVAKHEIKADDARIDAKIEEIAATYQDPEQVKAYYTGNQEQRSQIQAVVLEELVVEAVSASAKVSDKAMTYEDVIKSASQGNAA